MTLPSRRSVLGAGVTGAAALLAGPSVAAAGASGDPSSGTTGPVSIAGVEAAALPPTIRGARQRVVHFSDLYGLGIGGSTTNLAWNNGGYVSSGSSAIDVPLDIPPGSVLLRVDVYASRTTSGAATIRLNTAAVASSAIGAELGSITTATGTGILAGAHTTPHTVQPGEALYLESNDFSSSAVTFVGAIMTYYPPNPELHLLSTPTRVYDSRAGKAPTGVTKGVLTTAAARVIDCKVGSAVPAGARGVLVTATVTNTSGSGYLTLYRNGASVPGTSTTNWDHAGTVLASSTVVAVDSSARFAAKVGFGSTDLVVDVIGFYA